MTCEVWAAGDPPRSSAPSGAGRALRPFSMGSVRRRRTPPVATTLGPVGAGRKPDSRVHIGIRTSSSARPSGPRDSHLFSSPDRYDTFPRASARQVMGVDETLPRPIRAQRRTGKRTTCAEAPVPNEPTQN